MMDNTKPNITPEIVTELVNGKRDYMAALARSSGVSIAKERMKNLLFNYYDALVQAALDNVSLREEVASMDEALQEADRENDELKKNHKINKSEVVDKRLPKE